MKKSDTKILCTNLIIAAIKNAETNGFEVIVARDPEGNGFNSLKSNCMLYEDTKKDKIVLGVWKEYPNEEEIFNTLHSSLNS